MEVDAKTNGLNGELKEFLTLFFLSASFSFPSPLVKATAKWERIAVGFSFVPFALALNALNVSMIVKHHSIGFLNANYDLHNFTSKKVWYMYIIISALNNHKSYYFIQKSDHYGRF